LLLALDFIKNPFTRKIIAYGYRTIPRIATLLDIRFKKQGFLSQSNSNDATKALHRGVYVIKLLRYPFSEEKKCSGAKRGKSKGEFLYGELFEW